MAAFLLLLVFSPVFIFATHILLVRASTALRLSIHPLMTGVWAIVITLIALSFFAWLSFLGSLPRGSELVVAVIYGFFTYVFLAFCYFQIFAMTETARRLHILSELLEKGEMSLAQLDAEYGASKMMAIRLDRMVEMRQLNYDGHYYLLRGSFMLSVGRIMAFWAKVLGFKGKL